MTNITIMTKDYGGEKFIINMANILEAPKNIRSI